MQIVEEQKGCDTFQATLLPWFVCLSASLFFFYEFIQGNMFASIADNIMHDFHVDANKMTYLSSFYYLANVIFLFVAGLVLDRISAKKTIIASMILCVASTFILAQAQSYYLALLCRFMTGIGSAFCFLAPVRLASRWFPPQRMAMVTGIIVTIAMTGGMVAQYPLTKLVAQVGWREAVTQVGGLGIIMLIIMYFGIVEKKDNKAKSQVTKQSVLLSAKKAYLNPQILRIALYTSLMNMAIAVYGALIGPLYLVQKLGILKEEAAAVNSLLFLGAMLGGPAIGWLSDKIGLRLLPMKAGVIASLLTMLSILFIPVTLPVMKLLFFLLGFFTAAQVIGYALVAESSSSTVTATSISVVSILTQAGYFVYQNVFSFLLTWHNTKLNLGKIIYQLTDYQYAAMMFPIGLILAFILILGLRETHCRHLED